MKKLLISVAALACAALMAPAAHAGPLRYAIIGDAPYGTGGTTGLNNFQHHIDDINADPSVSLVVHLGDIKNGSTNCSTAYFNTIGGLFSSFDDPLVYTPGDNEWTDCHRANNGGYQPAGDQDNADLSPGGPIFNSIATVAGSSTASGLAAPSRLSEIRRIFFPKTGWTLGDAKRVHSQAEDGGPAFPENVRWSARNVVAGVLNVPGSNNDLDRWFCSTPTNVKTGLPACAKTFANLGPGANLLPLQNEEYDTRNAASLAWLDRIFDEAQAGDARAVLIGIQADMFDPNIVATSEYTGYQDLIGELVARTRAFGRPVLLMNGDSHKFIDGDRPLDGTAWNGRYGVPATPNLRRVTVDGSGDAHDYLRLTIDPSKADPFSWTRVPYTGESITTP